VILLLISPLKVVAGGCQPQGSVYHGDFHGSVEMIRLLLELFQNPFIMPNSFRLQHPCKEGTEKTASLDGRGAQLVGKKNAISHDATWNFRENIQSFFFLRTV